MGALATSFIAWVVIKSKKWQKDKNWMKPQTQQTRTTPHAWEYIKENLKPDYAEIANMLRNHHSKKTRIMKQLGIHEQHPIMVVAGYKDQTHYDRLYHFIMITKPITEYQINNFCYYLMLESFTSFFNDLHMGMRYDGTFDYSDLYTETRKELQNQLKAL